MNRSTYAAAAAGIVVAVWGSVALGSYAYLLGMGYPEEFVFPWNQLWVAIPWIVAGGWQGIGSLVVWEWAAIGVMMTFLPAGLALSIIARRFVYRSRQPDIWGSTGFANRREMERGGLKTRRKLF